ncbi:MAG: hypothetical protein ACE10K_04965 [Rhodothermales bacterium]
MASSQGLKIAIQVLLGIVIIALGIWLYVSITAPWAAVEAERAITAETRAQMDKVRLALIRHERAVDNFPSTLDSLIIWVKTDSATVADWDSLFGGHPDSLYYSPRTGNRFLYSLATDSLQRMWIYLLKDPDSDDHIGSMDPEDITSLNAASWQ